MARARRHPLVEDHRQVRVQEIPEPDQRAWLRWADERGKLVAVAVLMREAEAVTIHHRWRQNSEWRMTTQAVRLVASTPFLGGVRLHLECPDCRRRAVKLFDLAGRFTCKRCGGLVNRSQSQGAFERALLRAARIRRRLGADGGAGDPIPPRPKGMRWRTYEALVAEVEALERLPPAAWLTDGHGVALGVRRSRMGAKGRCRWWPGRNHRAA